MQKRLLLFAGLTFVTVLSAMIFGILCEVPVSTCVTLGLVATLAILVFGLLSGLAMGAAGIMSVMWHGRTLEDVMKAIEEFTEKSYMHFAVYIVAALTSGAAVGITFMQSVMFGTVFLITDQIVGFFRSKT